MESTRLMMMMMMMMIVVVMMMSNSGVIVNGQVICNVPVNGLMACKPAVTKPRPAPPTSVCCQSIGNADFKCFCAYKSSLPSLGIDLGLVFQLPKKCGINKSFNC